MKLAVMTCAVFPSESEARQKLWIFLASCKKAGVPPEDLHLYGTGHGFPGYKHMKLEMQLEYLKSNMQGYSHVLYHDGWDGFFTGPLTEVKHKYEMLGAPPILASASQWLGNVSNEETYKGLFDSTRKYRYPCVGGYIAEVDAIIDAFERMLQLPNQTGDDCFNWYDGWAEGWFRPQLDSQCEIFKVRADDCRVDRSEGGVRLLNTLTDTHPCLLHLSGGFSHQKYGKDDSMAPWAVRLGVITQAESDVAALAREGQ